MKVRSYYSEAGLKNTALLVLLIITETPEELV